MTPDLLPIGWRAPKNHDGQALGANDPSITRRQKMKRRDALKNSAAVLGLLLAAGVLPQAAHAAYNKAAFDAKTMAEVMKA
ncbi:MAG: twin-arginine translocation signal domain-containing protein, partial [Comamonas sp.]